MKLNKSFAALAAGALLLFASCSEGQYWTEPTAQNDVVAFAKPAVALSVEPTGTAPSSYTVTISRANASAEETVDVEFTTAYPDVISAPATATFQAGELTADYVISIGSIMPGVSYTAKATLKQPEDAFVHADDSNLEFQFSISQQLVWTEVNTAIVQSQNWAGTTGEVKVEEGNWPVAGERLFRLLDVYYVLEPDYAEPGTAIQFFTDDQGNALRMGEDWSYIGEHDSTNGYYYFGCPAKYGGQFINEGNVYGMFGVMGFAAKLGDAVTPGWYENLIFQWDFPAK